jgi:hypothetical protein
MSRENLIKAIEVIRVDIDAPVDGRWDYELHERAEAEAFFDHLVADGEKDVLMRRVRIHLDEDGEHVPEWDEFVETLRVGNPIKLRDAP